MVQYWHYQEVKVNKFLLWTIAVAIYVVSMIGVGFGALEHGVRIGQDSIDGKRICGGRK